MDSFLSSIRWDEVLNTLGSTAVVMAVLGFLGKSVIDHFFKRELDTHKSSLKEQADRDIEFHKAELKRQIDIELANLKTRSDRDLAQAKSESDRELAEFKARTDQELAAAKQRADEAIVKQKAEFDRQIAAFQTDLESETAKTDRIRQEIERWANPILGSVEELRNRLRNILFDDGYLALSPETEATVDKEWAIRYDYFLRSTVYLFCQYFCWVRLLEESLSFELFQQHHAKDSFMEGIYTVGRKLSAFPLAELQNLAAGDWQVFNLQQRALGEVVTVGDGREARCMRFSEFLAKWNEPAFAGIFHPLIQFVDRLQPTNARRWKRLELMDQELARLHEQCKEILKLNSGTE
jgi:hypothetical protein